MLKVCVTGATGFIGRRLCEKLLANGVTVYGVGRNQKVLDELGNSKRFHGIVLDFSEYEKLSKIIKDRDFDVFFHLANWGVNGDDKSNYEIQLQNVKIACDAVKIANVLGCRRFVFIGSVDEFEIDGRPDDRYIQPTHSRIYGVAKLAAEEMGKVIATKLGIEYVTALLALTYGEYNNTNILPNVIIRSSFNGKPVDLIEGNSTFDMIYVDEAVGGILAIAEEGLNLESYYVGHSNVRTFKEIVEEINSSLENPVELRFGVYKDKGNPIDFSKINREKLFLDTGYECNIELKEGISNTYNWIKEQYII